MNDRFFLDTNLFIYAFDASAPAKARRANELIRVGLATQRGMISYQVAQEFMAVALRRWARPLSAADASAYLTSVLVRLWRVQPSHALLAEAAALTELYRLPWYDALIVAAALEAECTVLYSEDFQDGRRFGPLRVENPF